MAVPQDGDVISQDMVEAAPPMVRWHSALLAAAAVEASAGLALAVTINGYGGGHKAVLVFVLCTAGLALSDLVLVPGWVWHPRPPVVTRLLGRTLAAVLALVAAVIVAFFGMLLVITIGLQLSEHAASPVRDYVLTALPFAIGGAVAGLGAAITEATDSGPGRPQPPWRPHILGGAAGVLPVLLLAAVAELTGDVGQPQARVWWPLLGLAPAALVLGGVLRNMLLARNAVRTGTPLAEAEALRWRAVICCAPFIAFAVVAVVLAAAWS